MGTNLDALTHRDAPGWAGLNVLVTGLGVSGFAAADALLERGANVTVVDGKEPAAGSPLADRAEILGVLGAHLLLGPQHPQALPEGGAPDLIVTSPGWAPHQPLLAAAAERAIPIWGDVELAWRLRPEQGAAPWITVTGTNGKTTTVQMLASILSAAGLRATSAGNVGTPVIEAIQDPQGYQVIAVELSSFQLHWSHSLRPLASACLNIAPDHVDWHGSLEEYTRAKGKVYENTEIACVYNVADPVTERLVEQADVQEGCRAIGFTLGMPAPSMVGLVEEVLADRAFIDDRQRSAAELGTLDDLRDASGHVAPHVIANALAAAALARAAGVPTSAIRDGLRAWTPEPHRIAHVATKDEVTWIDDSKATNPHAATASLTAYPSVVWIAGGLLKGAKVDELVAAARDRLRGVILIGADREQIAEAMRRHAPDVPVIDVANTDTDAMDRVVQEAALLARPGDVVLLAPAAASMDMFENYHQRGVAFAAAVERHLQEG
ncbi:UDP-N-acetylmuramoyl-L-alanine--D-glutamate ligase [Janibacter sp. GXQ6167]|uniref:UDP-N-acetylmuramoyl-L-alanine--D-glutamate ligase n=1 Tax=Janibacter sp. GXQ6167 TaxID=3240791 RepID=UPI00352445F1